MKKLKSHRVHKLGSNTAGKSRIGSRTRSLMKLSCKDDHLIKFSMVTEETLNVRRNEMNDHEQ